MDSGEFAHIVNENDDSVIHIRKEAIVAFAPAEAVKGFEETADYNTRIWLTTGETINVAANVGDVARAIYDDVV